MRRNHEQRVFIPGHARRFFKKFLQRIIRVLNTLLDGQRTAFESFSEFFWDFKWMVRRNRKHRCHEWLPKCSELCREIVKELVIPYSPNSVEVVAVSIFTHSVIVVEAGKVRERRKSHRSVRRSMKECRIVSTLLEQGRNTVDAV